ncbi:MAG: aminoacyl-tRNA hydrolase [Chloroflexi bacterium]|nr:aminoacyl-tRNA hydrolase [Chloroflexota bacterium]MYF23124.1 aminoacyl-tRNA hydrolase [Chloroflexota bacterium]
MVRLPKLRRRGMKPLQGARLIVGLGNPGPDYSQNRHNAGARSVEHIRNTLRLPQFERESRYRVSQGETAHGPVAVVVPRMFMNESGKSVQSLLDRYRAEPSDLVLLVDELDLEPGRIRIRASGSDAGQRGMRSIKAVIGELALQNVPRVRIGVGRPIVDGKPSHHPDDVADWLLSDPTPGERRLLHEAEMRAAEAVVHLLEHGVESAMNVYNRVPAKAEGGAGDVGTI